MDRAIEMGVAPTEIGYQQQFSKVELKAKLAMYPGKEVGVGGFGSCFGYRLNGRFSVCNFVD